MADYFKRVQEKTATKFWINNVTQEQARLAIEAGARNCTQNPTYSWKILNSKTDGEEAREILDGILREEPDDEIALMRFQLEMIARIAKILNPSTESRMEGMAGLRFSPAL